MTATQVQVHTHPVPFFLSTVTHLSPFPNKVGGQRVTLVSTFPTAPFRTGQAPFKESGSPGPQVIFPGLLHHPAQRQHSTISGPRNPVSPSRRLPRSSCS